MKIYKTKTGQPYIKLKNGKARFIKRSSIKRKSIFKSSITKNKRYKVKMAKKKTYRKTSTGMFGNLNKPMLGAAGVVAYESFLSPMIPLQGTAKDLLELVGGLYLSKKKGFLGATGKSLVVLNSYQLIAGLVGNKLTGLVTGSTGTSNYSYADI